MSSAWLRPTSRRLQRAQQTTTQFFSSTPPTFLPPPPLAPPPRPVPASIHASRQRAREHARSGTPLPEYKDVWEELRQSIDRLPVNQGEGLWVPLGHRPRSQVEAELVETVAVLVQAHAVLSGPVKTRQQYLKSSVVKVVAHTMRLLLHLGRWRDAQELDRAFFSPDKSQTPIQNLRQPTATSPTASTSALPPPRLLRQPFNHLDGLDLPRGSSQLAWINSLALRLRTDAHPSLADFLDLLAQFRTQLKQQVKSHISQFTLACLSRMSPFLSHRMEHEGVVRPGRGEVTVTKLLHGMPGSDRTAQRPMVVKAVAEARLDELEEAEWFGEGEWQKWQELTELTTKLMDDAEDAHGPSTMANDALGVSAGGEEEDTIERQAERLHIAIRTLLLQARLRDPTISNAPEAARLPPAAKSIASAIQLHNTLNNLTPGALASPTQLVQLRTKQSASLYRLLWASVQTLDIKHAPEAQHDDHDNEADAPELGKKAIVRVHTLLADALDLARTVPPPPTAGAADARLLGVSSRFFRRLLVSLALPAAPSRRAPPHPPATRPPWPLLHRTLDLILEHRAHDALCGPQPPPPVSNSKRLLNRSSMAIHLVRAALLGGSDEKAAGEGTPEARLAALLDWLTGLEERTGEAVDRKAVYAAVKVVTKRELKGEVWAARRDGLRAMTKEWVQAGETDAVASGQAKASGTV